MSETIQSNPSLAATARWTAAARAQESARPGALFQDPWAGALAGEEGARWLAGVSGSPLGTLPMIIRTRYFDEFLTDAVWQGYLPQVVLLGAGLDTRAYRMDWPPGVRLFELDLPAVLEYKAAVLTAAGAQPRCHRSPVPADLGGGWDAALTAAGFDPCLPAVWLLEGLLFYLPCEGIERTLDALTRLSRSASRLGFDIVNQQTLRSPITKTWIEMQARLGAPWSGWVDDPRAFLDARGWQAALTQPGAPDASYGRWTLPVIPIDAPDLPHSWYVTAEKR